MSDKKREREEERMYMCVRERECVYVYMCVYVCKREEVYKERQKDRENPHNIFHINFYCMLSAGSC